MTNAVMFTAIPNGFVTDPNTGVISASLSVYVTPQLQDASLATVPAFVDWPAVARTLSFSVQFRGTSPNDPSAPATLDQNPAYALNRFNSSLWKTIFGLQSAVHPWNVQDYRASGLLSYRTKDVSTAVKAAYKYAAAQSTKPTISATGIDPLSKRTADIAVVLPHGPDVGNAVRNGIGVPDSSGTVKPSLSANALGVVPVTAFAETPEFARAAAHHNRDNYRNLAPKTTPVVTPPPDFHQVLGYLADHPVILRQLGLVIDLLLTVPVGQALDGYTNVFVQPTTPIPGLIVNHPWTYCLIHAPGSAPVPTFRPFYGDVESSPGFPRPPVAHPLIDTNGLLRLDDEKAAHVDDLDIDHAAIHVSSFAEKATKDLAASAAGAVPVTLPALRTVGFALHHTDREAHTGLRFQDTMSWNPSGSTFVAENLVRGYRVDVKPAGTSTWSSLCLRRTTFTFANGAPPITVPAPDEGYVKASSLSTATDEPLLTLNESIFHWDGWSLVAARPGMSVGSTGSTNGSPAEGPVDGASNGAALQMPFTTTSVAQPGSLSKLRFGSSYQFRVRAVDLCGNDMVRAASDNTKDHSSPVKRFTRYEPVSPPVLQIRRPVTEGESLEHLVVRSDPYAATPLNAAAWATKNATVGMNLYAATCERHVAPPKTSVQHAEYHGAIDRAVANVAPGQARADAAWAIVSKEDGSFHDRYVTDSTTGQYRTREQLGRSIVTPPLSMTSVAGAQAAGQPTFTGNQDISPRGTALQQGQYVVYDTDTVILPYLPDPNATGVTIQGLAGTPLFRTYGARASNPSGGAWPELASFRVVLNESPSGITFTGLSTTLTSASDVTTISLPPATTLALTYSSALDDPTVHAFGPASTADAVFPQAQKGLLPALSPSRSLTLVHAVQRPRAPTFQSGDVTVTPRNEGETSQVVNATLRLDGPSTGRMDLVASWVEYVDVPSTDGPQIDPSTNPVPHNGTVASFTTNVTDAVTPQTVRHMFGDTKRRDITYGSVATTRFREYFPASITSDTTNITTTATYASTLICKSSARPPIPRVLYAVPSFSFSAGGSGSTSTRTRSGGIVRIYVDRGWFASGADERIGVVLAQSASDAKNLANLVSVWGEDPIWLARGLSALDTSHVSTANVTEVVTGVSLAEGAGTVNLATYRPTFNAQRGLWYFDIGLNVEKSYFPFLRLALVRYQPQSIGTLHMSPVVGTEFTQLAANRTASVVDFGSGKYSVSLSGPTAPNLQGPLSGTATAATWASGHVVTAEFQQATTAVPDAIDWVTIGNTTPLTAVSVTDGNVAFQASVTFPSSSSTPGSKHRIVLREYEIYAADAEDGVRDGIGIVQIGAASTSYKSRLVYVDALNINI